MEGGGGRGGGRGGRRGGDDGGSVCYRCDRWRRGSTLKKSSNFHSGLDILPVSALRERGATREEVGGQSVTVVTEWGTLPGSALKEREMM